MPPKKPMKNKFNQYSVSAPYFCNFSELGCDYHCHTDFYEFCLIVSGTYRNKYQGEEMLYGIGHILFFGPGESHTFVPDAAGSHHYAIVIEQSFFREYCMQHLEHAEQVLSTSHVFKGLSGPQLAYLTQLASMIQHSASLERLSTIKQFLSCALFACFETFPDSTADSVSIYAADLLHRLDSYQILTENVANLYYDYPISQALLINDFKRLTGYTIVQYRNLKRLEYAAHLLTVENYSISSVASTLNISSLSYFSQQFKEKYGISPKQYQLMYRSKKIKKDKLPSQNN